MDEMERRIQEYAARWVASQPEPAGEVLPRKRRLTWIAPVAAAASTVVIAAVVSTVSEDPAPAPATPSADVVPWAPLAPDPAPQVTIGPSPKATPSRPTTGVRDCSAADVETSAPESVAWGHGGPLDLRWAIQRRGHDYCRLRGIPDVVASGSGQRPVQAQDGAIFPTRDPSDVLGPGESAGLLLQIDSQCGASPAGTGARHVYSTVTLSLPGGGSLFLPLKHPIGVDCGLKTTAFSATSSSVPDQEAADPEPFDYSVLRVTLKTDGQPKVGERLRYSVELSSTTGEDVPLDPCPTYTEVVGDRALTYLLNCAAAPPVVSASRPLVLAMEAPAPAASPGQRVVLRWSLGWPGHLLAPSDKAVVQLTSG